MMMVMAIPYGALPWAMYSFLIGAIVAMWRLGTKVKDLAESMRVVMWQHRSVWNWWKTHHPDKIPVYPSIFPPLFRPNGETKKGDL